MDAIEQLGPPVATHGEGPLWDDEARRLLIVDIPAGDVLVWEDDVGAVPPLRRHLASTVGAVRVRAHGGLVAGIGTGFALVDPDWSVHRLEPLWTDPDLRMNDGTCDPAGRFWCGSMSERDEGAQGRGSLWRMDVDVPGARGTAPGASGGAPVQVLRDVTISNGMSFSDDGTRAFYVDTPTKRVDLLHVDAGGAVVGREPWVHVQLGDGVPDGICRDAEGGLWVALHEGAAVVRFDADGQLDAVVRLPVGRPTACTFGGPDLDVLYVTTSTVDAPDDEQGRAGALFALRPGVRGLPAYRFAG